MADSLGFGSPDKIEVWLARLYRAESGALMGQLTDPRIDLTDDERAACEEESNRLWDQGSAVEQAAVDRVGEAAYRKIRAQAIGDYFREAG